MKPARAPLAAARSSSATATSMPSSTGIIGRPTMRCGSAAWKSSRIQSLYERMHASASSRSGSMYTKIALPG